MLDFEIFKSASRITKLKRQLTTAKKLVGSLWRLRVIKLLLLVLGIGILFPVILVLFSLPHIAPNISYGVTFSNKYATELGLDWQPAYLKVLDELKPKTIRLIAYWDEIEKTPDNYDYSNIEWQLAEAQKRGVSVLLTLGRKVPRWPECFEPEWYKQLQNEQALDYELYDYVKTTVKTLAHYDAIKMWQVENEPFFPFGNCREIKHATVKTEISIVKSMDSRPILVQDSGEGGKWFVSYRLGDQLGISMYRKIWFDFWGIFFGKSFYFQYPLSYWTYKIKADIVRVPIEKIVVTELQAEPWGSKATRFLTEAEKDKTMSKTDFLSVLAYAQKTGFNTFYLWGVEWWLWEKEVNNKPFYWDTAKALFNN